MSVPNVNCKIKYIQNEEDLAKSSVLAEKYGGNRQFYSSRLADDYMKYMDKGSKPSILFKPACGRLYEVYGQRLEREDGLYLLCGR